MTDIREQIAELLTGEHRSLSVHEQWEYAQTMKRLLADLLQTETQLNDTEAENIRLLAVVEAARDWWEAPSRSFDSLEATKRLAIALAALDQKTES